MLTLDGQPAADIPIPFATMAECVAAGSQRVEEIKTSDNLSAAIWVCIPADFAPVPAHAPSEPILPKREG